MLMLWIVDAVAGRIKPRHPTAVAVVIFPSRFWAITIWPVAI
jgi:hypothetical protein